MAFESRDHQLHLMVRRFERELALNSHPESEFFLIITNEKQTKRKFTDREGDAARLSVN